MKRWSFFDDNLDIDFGIQWRAWGIGGTVAIHGDLNTFHEKFGPLFFSITYWRLSNDYQYKR